MKPETSITNKRDPVQKFCTITGLKLGDFIPSDYTGLGTSPFLQQWKQLPMVHPVFDLSLSDLIRKSTACIMREQAGSQDYSIQYKQLLFLALLHSSGYIKQDIPALPSSKVVATHLPHLVEILGWMLETNTDRLRFPTFHVWKGAALESENDPFGNIGNWLKACEACKDDYETVVRERKQATKQKARELALRNIRSNLYKDISLRRLWNWVATQVDSMEMQNNEDLAELFFSEEKNIHLYTEEDITALEDLILKNCELGNSISHEVMKRIEVLKVQLADYNDMFTIVTEDSFPESKGIPEPKASEFASKAQFAVAHARWSIANKAPKVANSDAEEL